MRGMMPNDGRALRSMLAAGEDDNKEDDNKEEMGWDDGDFEINETEHLGGESGSAAGQAFSTPAKKASLPSFDGE